MKCTACGQGDLSPCLIDGLFRAHNCSNCGGYWILVEDFVAWKENHPNFQFAVDAQLSEIANDSKKAMLCPITGTLMQKYKISANCEHKVDYSPSVGGLWLDKGEWQLLKSEGIAGALNSLVTQTWQKKIRDQQAQSRFVTLYEEKFGKATYQKVKEFRQWLDQQPQKADLLAYLCAHDPYSAEK